MPALLPIEIKEVIEERLTGYWQYFSGIFSKYDELQKENENLKTQIAQLQDQQGQQVTTSSVPILNSAELEAIKQKITILEELVKNLKTGPDQYDLKKEFPLIAFAKSKLQLDYTSAAITGEILNQVFKTQLKKDPNNPNGFKDYDFSPRVINQTLTLKEWITRPTGLFEIYGKDGKTPLTGYPKDNTFDTAQPIEKKVALGTGTGKSTFFLRCLAHRNPDGGGATLVVPYSSLIGSVLSAHNQWLSKDDPNTSDEKKDERVIKCPICDGRHTNYEATHNSDSKMINVFTWWEFLDAYLNNPQWIKPWVVYDEGHTDTPAYQSLINQLKAKKNRPFKLVEMSATFGDLPTSRKLTGTMIDYYVTDFVKLLAKNPEIFKKTVIVFTDDVKQLNLKPLTDKKIKFIILNDSIKDYATDIVRSLEPPLLVLANRDYSVGFSFGDVNVISTGISQRTIIDEKGKEGAVNGTSDFADLLQERGRGARDPQHAAVWMSLIPTNGDYKGKLKDDYAGKTLDTLLKKSTLETKDRVELTKIIKIFSKPRDIPELSQEEGNLNLNRIFLRELKDKLDINKIMTIKPSEKGKREVGEFIFTNKLMKYFDPNQLPDLLIATTEDKINAIAQQYDWYQTPEEDDDHVYPSEVDAKLVGFYLQVREKWEVKEKTGNKLVIKFLPYKLDKNKVKV